MKVLLEKNDGTREVISDIPASDEVILRHDLLDPEMWLREGLQGIIASRVELCRRGIYAEAPRLLASLPTIPNNQKVLVELVLAHPDYKDRAARESAERAQRRA